MFASAFITSGSKVNVKERKGTTIYRSKICWNIEMEPKESFQERNRLVHTNSNGSIERSPAKNSSEVPHSPVQSALRRSISHNSEDNIPISPRIAQSLLQHLKDEEENEGEIVTKPIVKAYACGIGEEDAAVFFTSKIRDELLFEFSKASQFCQKIGLNYKKIAEYNTIEEKLTKEMKEVLNTVEPHIEIMLKLSHTAGIQEGINGYRSLLAILLKVLIKINECVLQCPDYESPMFPKVGVDFSLKRWIKNTLDFLNQLKVMAGTLALAVELATKTDDLFVNHEKFEKEEENLIIHFATKLPMDSFFGYNFGTQFSKNLTTILRTILLAQTSFSAAKGDTAMSNNWFFRGTRSLMWGAYYSAFPRVAAERFVEVSTQGDVRDMQQFWNLTEGIIPENVSSLSIPAATDLRLVIPPKRFEYVRSDGTIVAIVPPSLSPSMMMEAEKSNSTPAKEIDPLLPVSARLISFNEYPTFLVEENDQARKEYDAELAKKARKTSMQQTFQNFKDKMTISNFWKSETDQSRNSSIQGQEMNPAPSPIPTSSPEPSPINVHTPSPKQMRLGNPVDLPSDLSFLSKYLIIYFHGGGFVAQTTSSHLTHVRHWSKETSAPVLGVDYRLAPDYPFPTAFQECYYSYLWAIQNARKLGSTGEKIILCGDSAGGNLAAAVVVRAIIEGTRIPDGLILIYPAVYMMFVPSPSRLISAIDPLLPTVTLKNCFEAYLPKGEDVNPLDNPFLSPACASDEIFSKFPDRTYIMCGALDPLLDDSVFLAKRLVTVGKPVTLKIYDEFPHGFINLGAVPGYGKEMWCAVQQVSEWMKSVFGGEALQVPQ
eukprot:TRINITY_DN4519_c0_g1_i1.p1 TRINITY_DN4519_c0_g1~~TRINITY_DN4519_c0_g1_i1.p1  ORF type:complete len:828 (+),score=264.47 TRINITY_DN4519_c0_g1_i1:130-2613(+)